MFTRRSFLLWTAATLGGAALALTNRLFGTPVTLAQGPQPTRAYFFPYIGKNGRPGPMPRVVHIRSSTATAWDGNGNFYDAVNQAAVDAMVFNGLRALTDAPSWSGIWSALFGRVRPGGYQAGQKIAIKVNLNNSIACDTHPLKIDALPHPLIGLIKGMVAAGVRPGDVVIYDSIRSIPSYLRDPIAALYPAVQFVGVSGCTGTIKPGHGKDPSLTVQFHDANGYLQPRQLANVLYDATYLINMPIVKRHSGDTSVPVTLTFKGHFGSLNQIGGTGDNDLHKFVVVTSPLYQPAYNPLVDIYSNPNIKNKAILTVGDGLFGAFGLNYNAATIWNVFGDGMKSLFFSADPVAVDCVMADFLVAEGLVSKTRAYDYLFCAEAAGLGLCEGTRANPGGNPLQAPYGSGYNKIEYRRSDL